MFFHFIIFLFLTLNLFLCKPDHLNGLKLYYNFFFSKAFYMKKIRFLIVIWISIKKYIQLIYFNFRPIKI